MLEWKRLLIILLFFLIIILIIIGVYIIINNNDNNKNLNEYIPQEEISQEQMRQTIVSLYFKKEKILIPEARLIDVKELIDNPYEIILNMIIQGPKNDNLQGTIPNETKLINIEKQGEILVIDFSEEFILNHAGGEEEEKLTINSIVKTLTELTEINGIKIKINGEENKEFNDGIIKFDKIFYRED